MSDVHDPSRFHARDAEIAVRRHGEFSPGRPLVFDASESPVENDLAVRKTSSSRSKTNAPTLTACSQTGAVVVISSSSRAIARRRSTRPSASAASVLWAIRAFEPLRSAVVASAAPAGPPRAWCFVANARCSLSARRESPSASLSRAARSAHSSTTGDSSS